MTENWVPVDFNFADITTSHESKSRVLIVRGDCKQSAMKLAPVSYATKPEYWRIDVLRDASGDIYLPVNEPFEIKLDLAGCVGTKGIEVVGKARRETINI